MQPGFSFRPLPGLTAAALVALGLLVTLGVWQLERRAWKLDLIATVEARIALAPVPIETLEQAGTPQSALAYRPAVVAGRFDHARTRYLFVGNGPAGAPGFDVLTPLLRAAGPPILIDRGFVPQSLKAPEARAGSEPEGLVTVQGIVRSGTPAHGFIPKGEHQGAVWYSRDLEGLGTAMGLELAPFLIEAGASPNPGGWPLGGQTRIELRNAHLGYAITWFGLAIALCVVYLLYHRKVGRLTLPGRAASTRSEP